MAGLVFVSYAREDAGLILPLARALLHHGADLWVDQLRISPGANWDKSVEDALYRCAKMLLFLSPAAVASEEVLSELRVALNERKPVVPVLCQPCRIPRQLLLIQYVDLTGCQPGTELPADRADEILAVLGLESGLLKSQAESPPGERIRKRFDDVMHWQGALGLDQAVGRFIVLEDRFRFESEKRTFEMRFDSISAIREGYVTLIIETRSETMKFSASTFGVKTEGALATELQTYWLAGRPTV
jgi:hypothetical protein